MSPSPVESLSEENDEELDAESDATGVLARRLEELRDEQWLAPVLEQALALMGAGGRRVSGCAIEYCKIKPNRDINVALRATLSGPAGTASAQQRFACTLFADVATCRLKFADDERNVLPDSTRGRLAAAGFPRPVVVLDDPAAIVRAFPVDPELPGLAVATDPVEMLPLFGANLEACRRLGRPPRGLALEILHYKPRRSCAIHYRIDLDRQGKNGAGGADPCRVYGKLSRDERGVRHHELLTAAWEASLASGGLWRAARPVTYLPRWRLLLQEAVLGRDFRLVFADLTPDDCGPAELERARDLLDRITLAIRSVQRSPVPRAIPEAGFARLFAAQERNLGYMSRLQPRLAAELSRIRAELARLERETAAAPAVFAHGDFAHGNVLIDGDEVGIIDFDKACAAEPAFDVAYFLTHMWSFGIRHPRRMPHVIALWQHMREFYLGLAPEVGSERLALYEALDFASYVLRNFRKQSHQASWIAWAEGQIAAAWDRLEVAAGKGPVGKGAAP